MLTITKLKMWKDPGYTRECVEVPPAGSRKLPTPDYSSTAPMRPRKSEIMNEMQIPVPFLQLKDMSYLYIEVTDSTTPTPNTMRMFGWVLGVSEIASAAESCSIRWTPDWWRTCSGDAAFSAGTIRRSSDDTHARPSAYKPRRWIASDYISLAYDQDGTDMDLWVYVLIVGTSANNTFYTLLTSPLIFNRFATSYDTDGNISTVDTMVNLEDIYNGFLDEFVTNSNWALDSSNIIGVWIGNVCPLEGVYTDTYNGQRVWRVDDLSWATGINRGWIGEKSGQGLYPKRMLYSGVYYSGAINGVKGNVRTFQQPLKADDKHRYIIVDPFGNNIGEVPWGTTFSGTELTVDIGPSGAYGFITLISDAEINNTYDRERMAQTAGTRFSYNLPPVALTENYYSSYIISGQRDAARENMRISREREYENRLLGIGTSAAQGAAMGILAGNPLAGAAVGAGTGLTGAIGGRFINEKYDDKLLDVQDMLASKHSNGIALSGDGAIWLSWCDSSGNRAYQAGPYIIELTMEDDDEDEYDGMIALDGYDVFVPFTSLDLSGYSGPLRIEQLTINGSIPPEAKTAIKTKLENGIRINERNPTGTDPGA